MKHNKVYIIVLLSLVFCGCSDDKNIKYLNESVIKDNEQQYKMVIEKAKYYDNKIKEIYNQYKDGKIGVNVVDITRKKREEYRKELEIFFFETVKDKRIPFVQMTYFDRFLIQEVYIDSISWDEGFDIEFWYKCKFKTIKNNNCFGVYLIGNNDKVIRKRIQCLPEENNMNDITQIGNTFLDSVNIYEILNIKGFQFVKEYK